ncbi:hypothetical protein DFH27DRAFT_547323 [Peziza echinospora]|nr:hypothetical protein DFH27DRAFT_547323 [Peziza echinospora]
MALGIARHFVAPHTMRLSRVVPAGLRVQSLRWASTVSNPKAKATPKVKNPLAIQRADAMSVARRELLANGNTLLYPRIEHDSHVLGISEAKGKYEFIAPGENLTTECITVRGRIKTIREASSKLVFYDLIQDGVKMQVVSNWKNVGGAPEDFERKCFQTKPGDIVSFTGYPGRTPKGELSVFATKTIHLLSPCLHTVPTEIQDIEKRFQHRHVDLMIRPESAQLLRLRSDIINYIRQNFMNNDFTEVQTPIIADAAGGAIAKPFVTEAMSYRNRKLALRIAPELWLKRLVVGGMERVFEIGTQFRNEGIDATHNPEFTTCEFYQAYANLEDLILFTENLFTNLAAHVQNLKDTKYKALPTVDLQLKSPFKRIEFIPALEEAIGRPLPDLENHEEATKWCLALFAELDIQVPASPTLPRLLDKLSSVYIEPQCTEPTFIAYHPECLSPLSKGTIRNGRRVATRIEFFVGGKEIVNAYEEENSPTEQRRKFREQLQWKNSDESAFIGDKVKAEEEELADEAFVGALEWGLPPTAGWGMGIDRLCMLFGGVERINDVLTFGGLRGVLGQGGVHTTTASTSSTTHTNGTSDEVKPEVVEKE